jgi:hypothetical protein
MNRHFDVETRNYPLGELSVTSQQQSQKLEYQDLIKLFDQLHFDE